MQDDKSRHFAAGILKYIVNLNIRNRAGFEEKAMINYFGINFIAKNKIKTRSFMIRFQRFFNN